MSGSDSTTIIRVAGDKTKGFRFQKLRASTRLLERIIQQPRVQIYCAMEFIEDSALFCGGDEEAISVEENKQYTSSLSFNSSPVKNTIVAFLDADATYQYSQALRFGIYASATIADEKISKIVCNQLGLGTASSSFQILRNLTTGVTLSDSEVSIAKHLIEEEYRTQYTDRTTGAIRQPPFAAWTNSEFLSFLRKIDWTIGTESNEGLEDQAMQLVKKCPYYDYRHQGLDSFLLSAITDLLEKRSQNYGPIERMVGTSDIKNLYLEILAERRDDRVDPAYRAWDQEVPNDKRNLSEKLLAVVPSYPNEKLARLARRIAVARYEKEEFGREYVSLMLRVLRACEDKIDALHAAMSSTMTEADVDQKIEELVEASIITMNSLGVTWTYRVVNDQAVRGAVLTLFEECYLAFDRAS